jgi:hypothetical protein
MASCKGGPLVQASGLILPINFDTLAPESERLAGMRNHKPKEWTEAEMQLLVSMANQGASASEIATALERYIGSVKRVARDMCLPLKQ